MPRIQSVKSKRDELTGLSTKDAAPAPPRVDGVQIPQVWDRLGGAAGTDAGRWAE